MLKRITLLRHAKSSHDDLSLMDRERPLSKRGERDAPLMAQRMLDRGARPSLILTSPAQRARQTARLIARKINYPIEFVQGEEELYLAGPETLLEVVGHQDNNFNDLVVCAHNTGITQLANRLGRASIDNVPTCGMVVLEAEVNSWAELPSAHCTLIHFDYPGNRDTG